MLHHVTNKGIGRPVILLHGNSLDHGVWSGQLSDPALAHLRLIAIDLPGHGASPWNAAGEAYTMDGFAQAVASHVRGLGPGVVLVGHSLGGHIATRVPAMCPNIGALVLVNAPPLSGVADLAHAFQPQPEMASMFTAELNDAQVRSAAEVLAWPESPHRALFEDMIKATDPRVRSDLGLEIASGRSADEQAAIRAAGVPVHMVHGEHDGLVSLPYLESHSSLFHDRRVHTLPGAGHSPQLQVPNTFNHLLLDLMESHV